MGKLQYSESDQRHLLGPNHSSLINGSPNPLKSEISTCPRALQNFKKYLAENHADVFFSVTQLPRMNGEGTQTVIAVGSFYAQRLELVWTEDPNVSQKFNSRAIK